MNELGYVWVLTYYLKVGMHWLCKINSNSKQSDSNLRGEAEMPHASDDCAV